MHKRNHAWLVSRRRKDRNKIQSGDKIQNGGDSKFCRLMSRFHFSTPYHWNTWRYWLFDAIIGTAAVSIVSAKSRNAYCFQDKQRTTQAFVGPSHFWSHASLVT